LDYETGGGKRREMPRYSEEREEEIELLAEYYAGVVKP
jgi:hypothetical protein